MGLNLFQNLASKSEGKSGSFECKQPKVGKSYTTSFLENSDMIVSYSFHFEQAFERSEFSDLFNSIDS